MLQLVDTHCHLDGEEFDADRADAIERARAAGVQCLVAIGTGDGPPDLEAGLRVAATSPSIYATVGVHPHNALNATPQTFVDLERLAPLDKVLAIGEIGLDYHYDFSPREVQHDIFRRQLDLAKKARKPVVIHTREAWEDTVRLVKESGVTDGIFHCFSGGPDEARQALDLGFHISLAGIVTFPKASQVHAVAQMTPLERLLIETDSPYLAPVPHRGKRNEPAFLIHTARRIADLRGMDIEEFCAATTRNWSQLCLQGTRSNG